MLAGILRAQNAINWACDTYYKEFVPQMSQKDGHRDYLKYARSVILAKVVLAYTSDISKDGQRIEKERREFSSSVNFFWGGGFECWAKWHKFGAR